MTPDANPNKKYCNLETAIIESMSNHLNEKLVKFNKNRHEREPWMSYGILKSVNHKNKLYKELMKFNRDSTQFNNKFSKAQYNSKRQCNRSSIRLSRYYN